MGNEHANLSQDSPAMVSGDEIAWTAEPLSCVEAFDLLALDDQEVLTYARDLQLELESMRALLREALGALARANVQRDRYQSRLRDLVSELRLSRHEARALGVQVRALQQDQAAA